MNQPKVVIIGGGITGLTAAFTLKQWFEQGTISCTVLESSPRVGGCTLTHREDNLVLDFGPGAVVDGDGSSEALVRDLGLASEVAFPSADESLFASDGTELWPLPLDNPYGIPTSLGALWHAKRVSGVGKLRTLTDYVLPKPRAHAAQPDEPLGLFLRRRLGDEWVSKICEPLLTYRTVGNLDEMSLTSYYPELPGLLNHYGSLHKGAIRQVGTIPSLTLRGGLQSLTEQLFDGLRHFADVRTNTPVTGIQRLENGQYTIHVKTCPSDSTSATVEELIADVVVVAAPAFVAGQLLCGISAKAAKLSAIRYVSSATVMLGYTSGAFSDFPGTGLIVQMNSGEVTSYSFTSRIWPHTATDNRVLVRCDVGRAGHQEWLGLPDSTLAQNVESQLRTVLGTDNKPWFTKVMRFEKATPQYEVGHQELVHDVEAALLAEAPGLFIAGSGYRGVSISDCIKSGRAAAAKVDHWVHNAKPGNNS